MRKQSAKLEGVPGVAVERIVSLRVEKKDNPLGAWEIVCDTCPLRPHLEALNMKPKTCAAGIQTNCQGAVPLSQCEYYVKDSIESEGKRLTLLCRKQANYLISRKEFLLCR